MLAGFVSTGLRAAPALLLAGAALLAPSVQAQADDLPEHTRDATYWLARIHDAAGTRNYQGTFVVSAGGSVASARIAHFCRGENQFERIESLDGQQRQIYRHNEVVHSFWPRERVAVVETRQAIREFPALLTAGAERIVEHYDVEPLGEGRVAGHEAHVLLLRPKDGWRFGYRLWAEKRSGLLLRAEVFDAREVVLEASAFSELMIGVKPQPERVLRAMKQLEGFDVKRPVLTTADPADEGWAFKQMPPGFRHVSSVKRPMTAPAAPRSTVQSADDAAEHPAQVLQSIYSDGLTHVSVFIEPYDAGLHRREILMAMGATQTLVRRQGDWWLTVIGDVPPVTLRAFADGLERLR
ncbi:MAG: MucB/RseB C-terminal domain-containing protein [Methylibium sp.]|uniref:MucB/RseB C-terminal domain-containing protein n=1 Tax=Methylibium sp. TaxID=2067992 RepID=UPI0017E7CA4E|nr:MucB/RseB C-terminal domain-containing protein [Methylibium sp.]MBA3596090.1 MucB/RseB C-terminal domain-containing protein [Methylibium sp.]